MSEVYTEEELNSSLDTRMGTIQPWIAIRLYKKNMPKKIFDKFFKYASDYTHFEKPLLNLFNKMLNEAMTDDQKKEFLNGYGSKKFKRISKSSRRTKTKKGKKSNKNKKSKQLKRGKRIVKKFVKRLRKQ